MPVAPAPPAGQSWSNGLVRTKGAVAARARQRRAIAVALAVNGALLVAEVVAGLAFRSLALLADAAHLVTDVAGLGVALLALALVERPATLRHSFGLQRAEVLGAQANGLLLLVGSGWILAEAAHRLGHPQPVAGAGLLTVALVGLVVNLGSAAVLRRQVGGSLNLRGALLHLWADAAGSLGAAGAGVAVLAWGADRADPIISIGIAGLVLWAAWRLLRDATHVLLEGTPREMDPREVEEALAREQGVAGVHHVHLWNLASDVPALSAHIVLAEEASMHEAEVRREGLKAMLADRFGIGHATLEMECHRCRPAPDEIETPRAAPAGDRARSGPG
jgi:cobalt-zinc-cadmium efflux system protein